MTSFVVRAPPRRRRASTTGRHRSKSEGRFFEIATWRRAWTTETAMETATETDAATLTTTSVIERAIERVADALGASTRTLVVVFVTCAVGAVVARMMTTTTTRARDDASPMGANDRYRDARARARLCTYRSRPSATRRRARASSSSSSSAPPPRPPRTSRKPPPRFASTRPARPRRARSRAR